MSKQQIAYSREATQYTYNIREAKYSKAPTCAHQTPRLPKKLASFFIFRILKLWHYIYHISASLFLLTRILQFLSSINRFLPVLRQFLIFIKHFLLQKEMCAELKNVHAPHYASFKQRTLWCFTVYFDTLYFSHSNHSVFVQDVVEVAEVVKSAAIYGIGFAVVSFMRL